MSIGSRTACAAPIVGSALIIYNEIRRRRLHLPLIAAALALLVTAVFTFSVVNKARGMPHGLFNVPNVVQATASDMHNSTDSILVPVKQLVASVFVGFPIAEESARYGVDPGVLLDNANPLPGTTRSSDLERYWPYEWVPLSFAGEWFGAMGWVGQILIFGAMGLMFGLTMHNLQRSRFRLISFLPLALRHSSRCVVHRVFLPHGLADDFDVSDHSYRIIFGQGKDHREGVEIWFVIREMSSHETPSVILRSPRSVF